MSEPKPRKPRKRTTFTLGVKTALGRLDSDDTRRADKVLRRFSWQDEEKGQ